ncbi:MAG: 6,7-dimethyl-8-ribityllumazine synthase [Gammaproteobacteria bacterium AqS3]|nr:6,7-dimethyl-8-ribityllumazine synthase [Gammaproteobacteria bacterium AqS3]
MAGAGGPAGYELRGDAAQRARTKIGIVFTAWHSEYVDDMFERTVKVLRHHGVGAIESAKVPGAFELPQGIQMMLAAAEVEEAQPFDAVIALGVILRGETSHYDVLAQTVTDALMRISLEELVPVIFGVLTVEDESQIAPRLGRSEDAARAALYMSELGSAGVS